MQSSVPWPLNCKLNEHTHVNEMYICYNRSLTNIYETNRPLQHEVVLESTYRMMILERVIMRLNPQITIIGYNTDAICTDTEIVN